MKLLYFRASITLWIVAIVSLVAVGCQSNPIASAQTLDQKAYALYGTFVVFEEQAASVIKQPATPPEVKSAIRIADAKAKPAADALLAAVREYLAIKKELAAGATPNDQLLIATNNLQKWVTDSTPLIQNLVASVGGK